MASLREFFEREAGEYLERLDKLLAADGGNPDTGEFQRLCRALRGSAQMAREGRVQDVASVLESAARGLSASTLRWTADLRERVRHTLDDLRMLVAADGTPDVLEERVVRAVERWREAGVEPAARPTASVSAPAAAAAAGPGEPATHAAGVAAIVDAPSGADDFFRYAAVEVAAVVAELNVALPEVEKDRRRREPIVSILRRERALLGAADLDRLGPVARVLRALDEVSRVAAQPGGEIQDLVVEFLRETRELLVIAPPLLKRGKVPEEQPSLQHLFTLRDQIIEGHGAAVPPLAAEDDFPVEVVNFFRTESRTILDRIERVSRELASISEDRAGGLRDDVRSALTALRDTARTFGFAGAATQAEHALGRVTRAAPNELREIVSGLRRAMGEPARSVEPVQEGAIGVEEPVAPAGQSEAPSADGAPAREAGVPSGAEAVGGGSRESRELVGTAAAGASTEGETAPGLDEVEPVSVAEEADEAPVMPWPEPAAQWPTGLEHSSEDVDRESGGVEGESTTGPEDGWWLRGSEVYPPQEPDTADTAAPDEADRELAQAAESLVAESEPAPEVEAAPEPEAAQEPEPALESGVALESEPTLESEAIGAPEAAVMSEAAEVAPGDVVGVDDSRVAAADSQAPEVGAEAEPVEWPTGWVEVDGGETHAAEPGPARGPVGDGGVDAEPRPIEAFLYSGDSAVRRADELRAELERLVDGNERARALIAELHDLVALAQP